MNKAYTGSVVLIIAGVFCCALGIRDDIMPCTMVGAVVIILGIFRFGLIRQALQENVEIDLSGDIILKYLEKDQALYSDMIYLYKRGNYEMIYGEIDGVCLYDNISHLHLASAASSAAAEDILSRINDDFEVIVTHEQIFDKYIDKYCHYNHKIITFNLIYTSRNKFKLNSSVEIKELDETYTQEIIDHYSFGSLANKSYIDGCLRRGMLGAFIDGSIVGFIGIHDSGAIGLLEVYPEYRNKKIGTLLLASYVNKQLEKHQSLPLFSQVEINNEYSIRLHENLNFNKAETPVVFYEKQI